MHETQHKIVIATAVLVHELGLEGSATAKIAQKAKIAIGTLFHHYSNKQKLLEATHEYILDDYVWYQIGFFDYPEGLISKQLKQAIKASIDYWVRNPAFYAFMDQLVSSAYYNEKLRKASDEKVEKHLGHHFELALKSGIIRKYDYQVLIHVLFNSIFQVAGLIIAAKPEEKKKYRREGIRFIWSAIGAGK